MEVYSDFSVFICLDILFVYMSITCVCCLNPQTGEGVCGSEQLYPDQTCYPDPGLGVRPVPAPSQPQRRPHQPGSMLHRSGHQDYIHIRAHYTGLFVIIESTGSKRF